MTRCTLSRSGRFHSARYKWFTIVFSALTLFMVLELLLEVRAMQRGWDAFWLNSIRNGFKTGQVEAGWDADAGGPASGYSLDRNVFVSKERPSQDAPLRIVVLGSSPSQDMRVAMEDLWVSRLRERLKEIGAADSIGSLEDLEVINASWAGQSLSTLYPRLVWVMREYRPDVVLLYELSNSINEYSHAIQHGVSPASEENTSGDLSNEGSATHSLLDISGARRVFADLFGKTTIYAHLKQSIGVPVVAMMHKEDGLGLKAEEWYLRDLERHRLLCEQNGVLLLLTEFLYAADVNNAGASDKRRIRECFRYNSYLSEDGWLKTLHRFNEISRSYAEKHRLLFLSVRSRVPCSDEFFRDLVHFTRTGHDAMGKAMADAFSRTYMQLYSRRARYDF